MLTVIFTPTSLFVLKYLVSYKGENQVDNMHINCSLCFWEIGRDSKWACLKKCSLKSSPIMYYTIIMCACLNWLIVVQLLRKVSQSNHQCKNLSVFGWLLAHFCKAFLYFIVVCGDRFLHSSLMFPLQHFRLVGVWTFALQLQIFLDYFILLTFSFSFFFKQPTKKLFLLELVGLLPAEFWTNVRHLRLGIALTF